MSACTLPALYFCSFLMWSITSLTLHDVQSGDHSVLCDVSLGSQWPLLLPSFCQRVFDILHGLLHPGSRATQHLISSKLVWYGLQQDITSWTWMCLACQASKLHLHHHCPVEQIGVPPNTFSRVHVDLVFPLPPLWGFTYPLMCGDSMIHWPKVIPLSSIMADACACAVLRE